MGVILDSSILIAGERRRDSVSEVLERVEAKCGKTAAALSAVTAMELTHGVYRARTEIDRKHRESFVEELLQAPYAVCRDVTWVTLDQTPVHIERNSIEPHTLDLLKHI